MEAKALDRQGRVLANLAILGIGHYVVVVVCLLFIFFYDA